MKNTMKKIITFLLLMTTVMVLSCVAPKHVSAASPTDEIEKYDITVDVNEDGSLNILYEISWRVLESDSVGPMSWVKVGLPNKHVISTSAVSSNIKKIDVSGTYASVYLDRDFYEGEVADFSFLVVQDNMYQMNKYEEGYTVYSFTPGWFDDIAVDMLTIRWNADKMDSWTPECTPEGDYQVWSTDLRPGEKFTMTATYPNDAYSFKILESSNDDDDEFGPVGNAIITILAVIFVFAMIGAPFAVFALVVYFVSKAFGDKSGFSNSVTKKITRTKIEYYPNCPGCGASREEGKEICPYCGKNMIKKREIITEEQIPEEEKELKNKKTEGEYRYSGSPNTYMRVHVVKVPAVTSTSSKGPSSRSTSSHSSSHHSCACASSCACACACACAGGGRAGCTTKDFYRTNFMLKYLKKDK